MMKVLVIELNRQSPTESRKVGLETGIRGGVRLAD